MTVASFRAARVTGQTPMKILDLKLIAIPPHQPRTVSEAGEGRAVAVDLEPGEALPDPGGDGPAWLVPVSGEVELEDGRGERALAGPAALIALEPGERPEVRARTRARLLVVLGAASGDDEAPPREEAASSAQ